MTESVVNFKSGQSQLVGVQHHAGDSAFDCAVLIIVGGPQTRIGSHRQFLLLSRFLASNGISSMRYDATGMGDSDGEFSDFLDMNDDIEAAIQVCKRDFNVEKVVLWGLCDAASAALIYTKHRSSEDITGMVLLNPWVRSEKSEAQARVKHYYLARLKNKDFWAKVARLEINPFRSAWDFAGTILRSFSSQPKTDAAVVPKTNEANYIQHMLDGLNNFKGNLLLILSGNDLTAAEFSDLVNQSPAWDKALNDKSTERVSLPEANHTFSSKAWRSQVESATLDWLNKINR